MKRPRWTPAENAALARLYPRAPRAAVERAIPGRTWRTIAWRASTRGLRRPRRPNRWTAADDACLRARYATAKPGTPVARTVAGMLGRTPRAVRTRAWKLGALRARPRRWTPRELATLRIQWQALNCRQLRARLPGRTWGAIVGKARALGLPTGTPQGWTTLAAAARRAGFDPKQLRRILAWAGVTTRRVVGEDADRKRRRGRGLRAPNRRLVVQWDRVAGAVARWARSETTAVAAARLGVHRLMALRLAARAGHRAPLRGSPLRLTPETWDAIVAAYRPASTPTRRAA